MQANPLDGPQPGPIHFTAGGAPVPTPQAQSPDSPAMDSESAALLRGWLHPLIAGCPSWEALDLALQRHGYRLAFRDGRLCLTREGSCICSMRFLGVGLRELSLRLGRPAVRPLPGQPTTGVLCSRPQD